MSRPLLIASALFPTMSAPPAEAEDHDAHAREIQRVLESRPVRRRGDPISEEDYVHISVAFANALLQHRKSPLRALVFADDEGLRIGVLPAETLRELVREKLIEPILDPLQPESEEPEE